MASNSNPQLSAATALVQLLQEHPGLPEATWSIGTVIPDLHGYVHVDSMAALAAYADVLGGSVRAGGEYDLRGERVRRHALKTLWRDVPVEVVVALPVSAAAVAR